MAFSGFVAVRLAFPEDGPIDFEESERQKH